MSSKPGVALHAVRFEEGPYLLRRGPDYYLHYRLAVAADGETAMRMVVRAQSGQDRGYYFFLAPVSLPERGNVVDRPLAADGLTEFAQRGAVYWLDPDGLETPLEIRNEPVADDEQSTEDRS